jgi:hypothetical protein
MNQPANLQVFENDNSFVEDYDKPRSTLIPPAPPWDIPEAPRTRRSSQIVVKASRRQEEEQEESEPSWYPPAPPIVPADAYPRLSDPPSSEVESATPTWVVPTFKISA